ncbi:MAG: BON domain-containing protein [Proteobacteria bacterium]|nr:BON domain-containing protein [Pseudomonadota bacterium]MBU4470360.1 BON domain-containing protein [Pseudomonadota bacterium]MCG2752771.1 BON domain-containing protein [Desulfobacteraceae bacterium]
MKKSILLVLMASMASFFLINGNVFASETDNRIESSAKESYVFRTFLKGDDIEIQSNGGIVSLTGTVSEESHKALARETVVNLPGVKGVDVNLKVIGETPLDRSDAWLIARVKAALFLQRHVNYEGTEVSAEDGTITLRGEATSQAQKDLTGEYANDVEGVEDVENEITVKTSALTPGEKTFEEKVGDMTGWVDDASITALVKTNLLFHRSTKGLNTGVKTKDGVVTLSGITKNAAEKDLAGKFAFDVAGVKRVINNMIVE